MYQPDAYNTTYRNHYPNQYPATATGIPTAISYFPPFQAQQQPVKVEHVPPEPPEPAVTKNVASRAIESLVLLELQEAGYERAERHAVQRLELEVSTCAFVNTWSILFSSCHSRTTTIPTCTRICKSCKSCQSYRLRCPHGMRGL